MSVYTLLLRRGGGRGAGCWLVVVRSEAGMFSHCRDLSKTNTWQHPIWTLSKSLSGKDEIKTKKTKTSTVSKRSPINENVSCLKIVTKYMRPCFFFVFFGGGVSTEETGITVSLGADIV